MKQKKTQRILGEDSDELNKVVNKELMMMMKDEGGEDVRQVLTCT